MLFMYDNEYVWRDARDQPDILLIIIDSAMALHENIDFFVALRGVWVSTWRLYHAAIPHIRL